MRYLLGLDNGGTEIKCSLYDLNGRELSSSSEKVKMEVSREGFTERDGDALFSANCRAIASVMERSGANPGSVLAVGVTGYGNGVCLVDKNGRSVYPVIVSTDSRAASYVSQWRKDGTAERVYRATRQELFASQPPALIAWFKDNLPDVLEKASFALQVKDYIRGRLTGTLCLEYTDMSNSALLDIDRRKYAESVFEDTGIKRYRRLFSDRILRCTDSAGCISGEAAALTGLRPGTPVCAGLFDIDASCLAAGVLSREELCIVGGTWIINEYLTGNVEEGKGKMAATLAFLDGLYLISDSSATGVGNLNWYLDNYAAALFPGAEGGALYSACASAAKASGFRSGGPLFVPYLYASATAPGSRGAFLNITGADDAASMLRAVYEGVAFSSACHVERLKRGREGFKRIKFLGGASNSDFWCQMFADVMGTTVETVRAANPGTLGAALCAGVSAGVYSDFAEAVSACPSASSVYEPDGNASELYAEKIKRYRHAVCLVDSFGELCYT